MQICTHQDLINPDNSSSSSKFNLKKIYKPEDQRTEIYTNIRQSRSTEFKQFACRDLNFNHYSNLGCNYIELNLEAHARYLH